MVLFPLHIGSSKKHWMKELISLNLKSFTLHYELHFCPCSCVPADLWTLCRGVDAAHRWARGECWASDCGAPGVGHQALPPEAAGLLRTPLQTPAHNRQTAHSLVRTSASFEARLLVAINNRRKEVTFITKDPWRGVTWSQSPFLSLCMPQHTLRSHSIQILHLFLPLQAVLLANSTAAAWALQLINAIS